MRNIAFAFIALALLFAGCVIVQQERLLHQADERYHLYQLVAPLDEPPTLDHDHAIGSCSTDSDCAFHFGGDGSPRSR